MGREETRQLRIIAVSNNFPTRHFPEKGTFVLNNLLEMTRQGALVDVIAPTSWVSELRHRNSVPREIGWGALRVRQPSITTLPLSASVGIRSLRNGFVAFNDAAMERAVERAVPNGGHYDFCYAHFFPSGRAALGPMSRRDIPVFLNLGESDPWDYESVYGTDAMRRDLDRYAGVITVSQRNVEYLRQLAPAASKRVRYIPNGVDTARYKPLDREESRRRLGLPLSEPLAIFCGHFDERKGPLRAQAAIERVGIRGVFLGTGEQRPQGPRVLFAGSAVNADMPLWLNAADVFVLPTLSEGMSNAILEALACGVPLVISDRNFNREFVTAECAQFVDPADPGSIAEGIRLALDPATAARMRTASASHSARFSIARRIQAMFAFVRESLS